MKEVVVIDASLAAMWAIPERYSEQSLALAAQWAQVGTRLVAPCLLLAEVTNALYKRIRRGEMDLSTAQDALRIILGFPIEIREEPGVPADALVWAHRLEQPSTYDCHYLALAQHYRCDLWTGDQRLYNAVRHGLPWVKWVGSDSAT